MGNNYMAKSSFCYHKVFGGKTIMIIVPHEDDEINLAGATIYGAAKEGIRVVCVFVTDGDWEYPASVRRKEAISALRVLGIPENQIFFLGYPDGGMDGSKSIYMCTLQKHSKSQHLRYICAWNKLLKNMENIILRERPNAIFSVDLDSHPDHQMCSFAFDIVMGKILSRSYNDYFPYIFKGFAYSTAYGSFKDFYNINLLSTLAKLDNGFNYLSKTDNPTYIWEERVRFPVLFHCRVLTQRNNIIYKALKCHLSQMALSRAVRIINSDQVFWQRRTDNLSYKGKFIVSSGESRYLHDFVTLNVYAGNPLISTHNDYFWQPESSDKQKYFRCVFVALQHVESIIIYSNFGKNDCILKSELVFSNGFRVINGPLGMYGPKNIIDFPPQDGIEWIEFHILESRGENYGVSEIEIFKTKEILAPWIKILIDGHFAYEWKVVKNQEIHISIYMYSHQHSVIWYVNGKKYRLEEINSLCKNIQKPLKIMAVSADDHNIWDQISIIPISKFHNFIKIANLFFDQNISRVIRFIEKRKSKRIVKQIGGK